MFLYKQNDREADAPLLAKTRFDGEQRCIPPRMMAMELALRQI
jgi:hypothetical protein